MVFSPSSSLARNVEAPGSTPRILIVENDVITGLKLEEILFGLGFDIILHHRMESALAAAASEPLAYGFIDVNLNGRHGGLAVADALDRRNVPFILATGYARADFNGRHDGAPILSKPYGARDIERVLWRAGLLPGAIDRD